MKARTCKDVSEVSSRNHKSDRISKLNLGCLDELEVRIEVINNLSENPGQIDRVYSAEVQAAVCISIAEQSLDDVLIIHFSQLTRSAVLACGLHVAYLTIVKGSFEGQIVDILLGNRNHLSSLDGADAPIGMQNEH